MSAGEIIRGLRGDKSQGETAKGIGITKSALAMYERGERTPRDEVKVKIARYFRRSVQEIFLATSSTHSALNESVQTKNVEHSGQKSEVLQHLTRLAAVISF